MTVYQGKRAVALVSGGLDSIVSLAQARAEMAVNVVLFFNYGQRALERERHAAMGAVNFYELPFREVDLGWLRDLSPEGMRGGDDSTPALDTLDAVWIPNRNGVFLNVAASFAESYRCEYIVTGFNREEAVEFPDNSDQYVTRVNSALELSTRSGVEVVSFTQDLSKPEIVELGVRLGAPLSVVWSCYHSREHMCGRCASCRRLKSALGRVSEEARPVIEFEHENKA